MEALVFQDTKGKHHLEFIECNRGPQVACPRLFLHTDTHTHTHTQPHNVPPLTLIDLLDPIDPLDLLLR